MIKGTVSVISSNPPCKDGNARFTTVPLKALCDQVWVRYHRSKHLTSRKTTISSTFLIILIDIDIDLMIP